MIWSRSIVRDIRCLRACCTVSEEALRLGDNVLTMAHTRMWKMLDEMAHSWAVDLEQRDVIMYEHSRNTPEQTREYRAQWAPDVLDIGLLDGPLAGQRMTVPSTHIFMPLEAQLQGDMTEVTEFMAGEPDQVWRVPETQTVRYWYAGWSESQRIWIYKLKEDA